jgi:hypothetical protein
MRNCTDHVTVALKIEEIRSNVSAMLGTLKVLLDLRCQMYRRLVPGIESF